MWPHAAVAARSIVPRGRGRPETNRRETVPAGHGGGCHRDRQEGAPSPPDLLPPPRTHSTPPLATSTGGEKRGGVAVRGPRSAHCVSAVAPSACTGVLARASKGTSRAVRARGAGSLSNSEVVQPVGNGRVTAAVQLLDHFAVVAGWERISVVVEQPCRGRGQSAGNASAAGDRNRLVGVRGEGPEGG